jgi:hypothetical protein
VCAKCRTQHVPACCVSSHPTSCRVPVSVCCSALCNDSSLSYQPSTGSYTRIGESTELALRVFVEKVGLNVSCLSTTAQLESSACRLQTEPCVSVCAQQPWQCTTQCASFIC